MPARALLHVVSLLLAWTAAAPAGAPKITVGPIGVLGDSYSDEYRFYPPDRSVARNWVEILANTRGLDFGPSSEVGRGEPRNQGFAYNWARSDATTEDMISAGQHTGLAAQIARGEVRIACVFIGGNDFINALKAPDPLDALARALPVALKNHRTAIETLRAADPGVGLVLVTLPDIRNLPEFADPLREGRLSPEVADASTAAIRRFNAQVRSMAAGDPRAALIDLDVVTRMSDLLSREYVPVAGRKLDRRHAGNDLDHFFLADVRHAGTLGQGLMARLFIAALNAKFGAGIAPIEDREILDLAQASLAGGRAVLGGATAIDARNESHKLSVGPNDLRATEGPGGLSDR